MTALVDENLPVLGKHNAGALQRARRRSFEVDAADAITAPVTGALEFVFRREIVRRAAQMSADGYECEESARVYEVVVGRAHQPDGVLVLPPLVHAHPVLARQA